jgi:hypothetical protein
MKIQQFQHLFHSNRLMVHSIGVEIYGVDGRIGIFRVQLWRSLISTGVETIVQSAHPDLM